MANSPNLGLSILLPGSSTGPGWASSLESDKLIIDAHSHVSGAGALVPTAGLNINATLPFNTFGASSVGTVGLTSQSTTSSGTASIAYNKSGDIYWNNSSGVPVQITSGNALAASTIGGITNMGGTTAALTYSQALTTFIATSDALKSASLDGGNLTLRQPGLASAKGVTLKSPTSLGADYSLTLPTSLATSGLNLITYDSAGVQTLGGPIQQNVMVSGQLSVSGVMTASGLAAYPQPVGSFDNPGTARQILYLDNLSGKWSSKANSGVSYPLYMNVANKAGGSPFSSSETIVAGGKLGGANTPLTSFLIPANTLVVGSTVRAKIAFICNSSVANTYSVKIRIGTTGTTSDTAVYTAANFTAAGSAAAIPGTIEVALTVASIGASATVISNPVTTVMNGSTTQGCLAALSACGTVGSTGNFDSTVSNYVAMTIVASAATTSFQPGVGTMELI